MSKVDRIVSVTITRETKPVSQAAFDMVLILGENYTFDERYQVFSTDDLDALEDVLGSTSDPEYLAAEALASQTPRPIQFAAGRIDDEDTDFGAALTAILQENSNFFYVILAEKTVANQEKVADWCNANKRIFIVASAGTTDDIITLPDTASIGAYIQTNALDKCACLYHPDAATDYLDAGLAGLLAVRRPGTYTPMFKTVIGSSVDALTTAIQTILFGKYVTTYENVGGQNIIQEGWVGTGEFLDLVIWVEWLNSKIQTNVYSLLANREKVAFTSDGLASLENAIKEVLEIEQLAHAISPDEFDDNGIQLGGYFTSVPKLQDVAQNDKLTRLAKDIKFTCWYENPIHRVQINGIVKI